MAGASWLSQRRGSPTPGRLPDKQVLPLQPLWPLTSSPPLTSSLWVSLLLSCSLPSQGQALGERDPGPTAD